MEKYQQKDTWRKKRRRKQNQQKVKRKYWVEEGIWLHFKFHRHRLDQLEHTQVLLQEKLSHWLCLNSVSMTEVNLSILTLTQKWVNTSPTPYIGI